MNEGEIPQYYIRDNHKPIIPMDVLKLVRDKLKDPKKVHSQRPSFFGKKPLLKLRLGVRQQDMASDGQVPKNGMEM